jgi:hypothetical protein
LKTARFDQRVFDIARYHGTSRLDDCRHPGRNLAGEDSTFGRQRGITEVIDASAAEIASVIQTIELNVVSF